MTFLFSISFFSQTPISYDTTKFLFLCSVLISFVAISRFFCFCFFCNFPITHPSVSLFVGWLVCWSICHNFRKGLEVTLPCSNWNNCFLCGCYRFLGIAFFFVPSPKFLPFSCFRSYSLNHRLAAMTVLSKLGL